MGRYIEHDRRVYVLCRLPSTVSRLERLGYKNLDYKDALEYGVNLFNYWFCAFFLIVFPN